MAPSNRRVKKSLYRFMRRQLALAKGDRGEVFQLRRRQVFRRGPLPDLALHTSAKQGVRYLILLHFANFVSVYFANEQGTIMDVQNFDRKRDQQALKELPSFARRILEYPRPDKVPTKHERLLRKTEDLQNQFHNKIRTIEQLVDVHLPPRKIPGIALTTQVREGMIHIPDHLRSQEQYDRFFTIEAFQLFIPAPFHPHSDPLARVLTFLLVDDPTDRMELFSQLPKAIRHMVRQLPQNGSLRYTIRPIIALLRFWARYEDRSLHPEAFQLFFKQVMTELIQNHTQNLMEIAITVSEALFLGHGDTQDLLRLTCFLVLSGKRSLHQTYLTHEIFQREDNVTRFCYAMLTLHLGQIYLARPQIMEHFAGPKLTRLLQRAFKQLQKQILRIERERNQLTIVNQSDLELSNLAFQYSSSSPEEVLVTIPQLGPNRVIAIPLDQDLDPEELVAEFTDNFGNHYRIVV